MILARIQEEESSNFNVNRKERLFNRIKNPFRTTAFTIQKKKSIDQNFESSPQQQNQRTLSPEARINHRQHNQIDLSEQTCSNFMKNYVQKLKRQRKRDKKRLSLINQTKTIDKQSFFGCEVAPLPLIHNGKQQILIFQKIVPNSFKSSIIQPVPSASTLDNQKLADIIEEIRHYKSKVIRQTSLQFRKKNNNGFPYLQKKTDKLRQKKILIMDSVDPWEGDNAHNDLFLYDYNG